MSIKRGKTWYIDFEYRGKRYRKSLATASKQMAELALKDTDVKIVRERFDFAQSKEISFSDFSKKFLEWYEVKIKLFEQRTVNSNPSQFNLIKNRISNNQ